MAAAPLAHCATENYPAGVWSTVNASSGVPDVEALGVSSIFIFLERFQIRSSDCTLLQASVDCRINCYSPMWKKCRCALGPLVAEIRSPWKSCPRPSFRLALPRLLASACPPARPPASQSLSWPAYRPARFLARSLTRLSSLPGLGNEQERKSESQRWQNE